MPSILIVDDDPGVRRFLLTVLESERHEPRMAADGAEAIRMVDSVRPDLIITDVMMPNLDGYSFVRQLRDHPTLARTPVIFHTAIRHEQQARALAMQCGVRAVLIKPCSPATIVHAVNEALDACPNECNVVQNDFDAAHRRLLTNELTARVGELEGVNRRLHEVLNLGLQSALAIDPGKLFDHYCIASRSILDTEFAAIALLDSRQTVRRSLVLRATSGRSSLDPRRLPVAYIEQRETPFQLSDLGAEWAASTDDLPRSLLGVAIATGTQKYGYLVLTDKIGAGDFSEEDEQVATALAGQLATAYENTNRFEAIQQHTVTLEREAAERQRLESQLRAWGARLQMVREDERKRIAREIHDELAQGLIGLKMDLCWLKDQMVKLDRPIISSLVERSTSALMLVDETIKTVRRLVADLRPPVLDDLGLAAAVEWQAHEFEMRCGIRCSAAVQETADLSSDQSIALFRICQEALTNVARHSQATRATITMRQQGDRLRLEITDDGVGFERANDPTLGSFGLLGMQERATLIGGDLCVVSTAGQGTRIIASIPLHDDRCSLDNMGDRQGIST